MLDPQIADESACGSTGPEKKGFGGLRGSESRGLGSRGLAVYRVQRFRSLGVPSTLLRGLGLLERILYGFRGLGV